MVAVLPFLAVHTESREIQVGADTFPSAGSQRTSAAPEPVSRSCDVSGWPAGPQPSLESNGASKTRHSPSAEDSSPWRRVSCPAVLLRSAGRVFLGRSTTRYPLPRPGASLRVLHLRQSSRVQHFPVFSGMLAWTLICALVQARPGCIETQLPLEIPYPSFRGLPSPITT